MGDDPGALTSTPVLAGSAPHAVSPGKTCLWSASACMRIVPTIIREKPPAGQLYSEIRCHLRCRFWIWPVLIRARITVDKEKDEQDKSPDHGDQRN